MVLYAFYLSEKIKKAHPNLPQTWFPLNPERPFDTRKYFIVFILLMAIPRLYSLGEPPEVDLALYSVFAHELHEGRSLYSDLWDHKPPGVFLTFWLAQLIAGYGQGSIFLLGMVSSILTCFGVYYAASSGGRGKRTGLWAAAFWTVISADVLLQANLPNVEAIVNACLTGSFALMCRAQGHVRERSRWLWIGVLIAWASLCKHIAVFFALALAVAHFAFPPEGSSRKEAFFQILLVAAVGFAAWGLCFLYFFLTGHFTEFWDAVFVFNHYYAGNIIRNLWKGLYPKHLLSEYAFGLIPLAGICALGIIIWRGRQWTRTSALFLAYVISTFLMVSSPGKLFVHYYQLWFPVLAIGGAWAVAEIQNKEKLNSFLARRAGALVLSLLIFFQATYYGYTPEKWSQLKYKSRFVYLKPVATEINHILKPDEQFYVWGFDPGFYFLTKRSPISGLLNNGPLFVGPLVEELTTHVRRDFLENMPELLIVAPFPIGSQDLPLFQWLFKNYRPFPHQDRYAPYKFYCLKGSSLEKRILRSATIPTGDPKSSS